MDQVSAGSRGTWPQSLGYRSSRTIACPCRCSSWWRHSPQPHGCPDRNLPTKNMGAHHFDIAAGLLLPRFTTLIISMTVCMFIAHSREQTQIQPQVSPQMLVYNRKLARLRCLAKCNEVLWGYEFGFTVIFIHVHSTHKKQTMEPSGVDVKQLGPWCLIRCHRETQSSRASEPSACRIE